MVLSKTKKRERLNRLRNCLFVVVLAVVIVEGYFYNSLSQRYDILLYKCEKNDRHFQLVARKVLTPSQLEIIPLLTRDSELMEVTITAYDAWSEASINVKAWRDGKTSIGRIATPGRTIAVDPKVIPYDSRVYLPGIGWRIAEDTGFAIKGQKIDLLMATKQLALNFGRRRLLILWYPPKLS